MNKLMATLKEIANMTGVSITTVSRILNRDSRLQVTPETRDAVLTAAKKVGYIKINKSNEQSKIALIHWYSVKQETEDPYYLFIRLGVEAHARKRGIKLISHYFSTLKEPLPLADGAIVVGKFDEEEIKRFEQTYPYLVFVDSSPNPKKHDSVMIDFTNAYEEAYRFLINQGLTDIGYIGGREYTKTLKHPLIDPREQFVMQKQIPQKRIHIGAFNTTSGYQLMKQIIQEKNLAQAYLIGNDHMAIGVLSALHEAKINVPEDVSLIGFNDIEQSAFTIPPLSTIKVYQKDLGETAVNALMERIKGRHIPEKIILPTELIQRQTTKGDHKNHETSH